MKILFPTDGSDASVAALTHLVDRLGWFKDPRSILNVPAAYARAVAWAGRDAVQRYYDEEGDAALASSIAILEAKESRTRACARSASPRTRSRATRRSGARTSSPWAGAATARWRRSLMSLRRRR